MLSKSSLARLEGVHPDLVAVVHRAADKAAFVVTEGLRTLDRQKTLVASGASTTMRSRHLTGHAVDLAATVDGQVRWDWPLYSVLAKAMKTAASELGTTIEWGGDWSSFKDGPHFQLPWASYPATAAVPGTPVAPQTIRNGAGGEAVIRIQTLLNERGAGLRVDGDFGPATERAVRRFQTSKGLPSDGIVGPATWSAIGA